MAGLSRGSPKDMGLDLQGLGLRAGQVRSRSLHRLSVSGLKSHWPVPSAACATTGSLAPCMCSGNDGVCKTRPLGLSEVGEPCALQDFTESWWVTSCFHGMWPS